MKRGQVSAEFLMVFSFAFLMTFPLIALFIDQRGYVEDDIAQNQLRNIAIKIADKAEIVYYQGEPTKTTIKADFPKGVESASIVNGEISFIYSMAKGELREVVHVSPVNISGTLETYDGRHTIEIAAEGGGVSVSEK